VITISYANTLLDRTQTIQALEIEQEELRQELKKMKEQEKNQIDVDAPVQKVIAILQGIAADMGSSQVVFILICRCGSSHKGAT
jgi:hypothetical protein